MSAVNEQVMHAINVPAWQADKIGDKHRVKPSALYTFPCDAFQENGHCVVFDWVTLVEHLVSHAGKTLTRRYEASTIGASKFVKVGQIKASFQELANLPRARQLGLLSALGVSIVLSVYIVLWSRTLDYPFHLTESTQTIATASPMPGFAGDHARAKQVAAIKSRPAISVKDKLQLWDVSRQILGGFIAVLVLLGVWWPVMRHLAKKTVARQAVATAQTDMEQVPILPSDEETQRFPQENDDELNLEFAKAMVSQEPKRVAQVLKQWLNES